jgi:Fe-S-cluster containining protein
MAEMVMDSIETPTSNPRSETFGYVCHRCLKCCHHKRIQLNPYEVARLARNRGVTTSELHTAYTADGAGLYLAQTESGACVFLGSEGCTVHPDRPLACRLYPLGRHTTVDGQEWFSHSETHPQSHGEFTHSGTIADFLLAQGADPYLRAVDDYYSWLCAACENLHEASDGETVNLSEQHVAIARDLLDMDAAIARHCAATELAEPTDIEARRKLHLTILHRQLEQNGGRHHEQA